MDTGAGTAEAVGARLASRDELDAAEQHVRRSPAEQGVVELIVCRPVPAAREVVDVAEIDAETGLVGDCWSTKTTSSTPDGSPHPDRQVTLVNARAIDQVAVGDRSRWMLAGDQLYVDLDLSNRNLPSGTRLAVGSAVLEVTAEPHRGCAKFTRRFGLDAMRWVNSEAGRELNLRGINARVVTPGRVRTGDLVVRIDP
jgi:MOSC domain-containing protein YiiM